MSWRSSGRLRRFSQNLAKRVNFISEDALTDDRNIKNEYCDRTSRDFSTLKIKETRDEIIKNESRLKRMWITMLSFSPKIKENFFGYFASESKHQEKWRSIINKKEKLCLNEKTGFKHFIDFLIMTHPRRKNDQTFWLDSGSYDITSPMFVSEFEKSILNTVNHMVLRCEQKHLFDSLIETSPEKCFYPDFSINFQVENYKNVSDIAKAHPDHENLMKSINIDEEPVLLNVKIENDVDDLFANYLIDGSGTPTIEKMRHEICCRRLFEDSSDEKLSCHWTNVPGVHMNLTPDYIQKVSDDVYNVFEITTSQKDDLESCTSAAFSKFNKYNNSLKMIEEYYRNYLEKKITINLKIIVVNFTTIISNFNPVDTLDEKTLQHFYELPSLYTLAASEGRSILSKINLTEMIDLQDSEFVSKSKKLIRDLKSYVQREDLKKKFKNPNLHINSKDYEKIRICDDKIFKTNADHQSSLDDHFKNIDPKKFYEDSNEKKFQAFSTKRLLRFPNFYDSDFYWFSEAQSSRWEDCEMADTLHELILEVNDPNVSFSDETGPIEIEKEDLNFLKEIYNEVEDEDLLDISDFIDEAKELQHHDELTETRDEREPKFSTENKDVSEDAGKEKEKMKRIRGERFKCRINLTRKKRRVLHIGEKGNKKQNSDVLCWENDVDFIDDFLKDESLFEEEDITSKLTFEQLPNEFSKNKFISHKMRSKIRKGLNLRIFCYLRFWSLVFYTISKSLRHYTNPTKILIRNVEGTNAKVIIHNPGIKGPVWFSVISKNPKEFSDNRVFSKSYRGRNGDDVFKISNWVSVQHSDLEMYVNCFEIGVGVYESIKEIFKVGQKKTFLFCLLILLEAKGKPSADLLNLRYFYMELLKAKDKKFQAPFKIVEKFDVMCRSLLHLWIWKRLSEMFEKNKGEDLISVLDKIEEEEESDNEDDVKKEKDSDLSRFRPINFITMEECKSVRECLFLSYLGVLKNKRDVEKFSNSKKMLKKIIQMEMLLEKILNWNIIDDKNEDLNAERLTHQFSPRIVKRAARNIWNKISLKSGMKDKEVFFERKIVPNLLRIGLEDIATFKSTTIKESADFRDIREIAEEIKEKNKKAKKDQGSSEQQKSSRFQTSSRLKTVKRSKLISVVTEEIQNNHLLNPNVMLDVTKMVKDSDGFLVSLFKKDQSAGLREIYVLDLVSRILSLFVETISKTLCLELDNEILTKGNDKSAESRKHKLKNRLLIKSLKTRIKETSEPQDSALREKSIKIDHYHDAADRTTWCQQFVNSVFYVMLSELVPEWVLPLIADILNLHSLKLIQIPEELCLAFIKNQEMKDYEEHINFLKEDFLGNVNHNLVYATGSTWIRNESNMMQGILHFTSSLLHSSVLFLLESRINNLNQEFLEKKTPCLILFSSRVSSDDASFSLTMISIKRQSINHYKIAKGITEWHLASLRHFCIKDSIKSTHLITEDIQEFNSEFEVGENKVFPTLPHIVAALQLPSEVDPYKRILELYNTRTSLMEKGMSGKFNLMVNYLQCRIHYKCLMGASENYNHICRLVLDTLPIDFLGYFYFDNPYLGPLLGETFNRYQMFKTNDDVSNSFKSFVIMTGVDSLVENSIEIYFRWKQSPSFKFMMKYIKEIIGEIKTDDKIIYNTLGHTREVNENGEIVIRESSVSCECKFRRSQTIAETKCKIVAKTFDSNLSRSLSWIEKISMIGISAYFLSSLCVRIKKNFKIDEDLKRALEEFSKREHSFLTVLLVILRLKKSDEDKEDREEMRTNWKKYFPLEIDYSEVLKKCEDRDKLSLYYCRTKDAKMRKMPIQVFKGDHAGVLTMLETIKNVWYGISIKRTSTTMIKEKWQYMRIQLPWLHNSPKDTLKNSDCPFETELAIVSFFEKISIMGERKINVIGPYLKRSSFNQKLNQVIERYFDFKKIFKSDVSTRIKNVNAERWKNMRFFPDLYKRHLSLRANEISPLKISLLSQKLSQEEQFKVLESIVLLSKQVAEVEKDLFFNLLFSGPDGSETYHVKFYDNFTQCVAVEKNNKLIEVLSTNAEIDVICDFTREVLEKKRLMTQEYHYYKRHKGEFLLKDTLSPISLFDLSDDDECIPVLRSNKSWIQDSMYSKDSNAIIENSWMAIQMYRHLNVRGDAKIDIGMRAVSPKVLMHEYYSIRLSLDLEPTSEYMNNVRFFKNPESAVCSEHLHKIILWRAIVATSSRSSDANQDYSFKATQPLRDAIPELGFYDSKIMMHRLVLDLRKILKDWYKIPDKKTEKKIPTEGGEVRGAVGMEKVVSAKVDMEEISSLAQMLKMVDENFDTDLAQEENESHTQKLLSEIFTRKENRHTNIGNWDYFDNVWRGCKFFSFRFPVSKDDFVKFVIRIIEVNHSSQTKEAIDTLRKLNEDLAREVQAKMKPKPVTDSDFALSF